MAWKPFVEPLGSPLDPVMNSREFTELVFRKGVLNALQGINDELRLLNARIEEAFQTTIEGGDV